MADSSGLDRIPVQVSILLNNGETMRGTIGVNRGRKLGDLLNSGVPFVLVESSDGHPIYLALASVMQITSSHMPAADQLDAQRRSMDSNNPYQVLGLDPSCSLATLQQKHRDLVKLYHPDQYINMRLPEEVTLYISDMAKRINMAFSELSSEIRKKEALQAEMEALQAAMRGPVRFGEGKRRV